MAWKGRADEMMSWEIKSRCSNTVDRHSMRQTIHASNTIQRVTKKESSEKNYFSCIPNKLTIFGWHIYVEIQTILILLLYICGDYIQVKSEPDGHHDLRHGIVDVLWAYGRKVCGILNA